MLVLTKKVYNDIVSHSKADFPIEACGYLAGKDNLITYAFKLKNMDNSPEHFSFNPEEQFATFKKVRSLGLSILGVYHSHPYTPARMSEEDIRLAYDENLYYAIISLVQQEPDLKIFKVKKGIVEKIEYQIMEYGGK